MTAKDYMKELKQKLSNVKYLSHEIKLLEAQIKMLEDGQLPTGIRYDKDKVMTSPDNQMESFGWKVLELERQISNAKEKLVDTITLINKVVEGMPTAQCRQLILLRYINGYSWWRIGNELGYSEYHTRTDVHSKALTEMCEVYKQARSGTGDL